MHLPFLALVAICTLSALLPVPRQYVSDGSVIHETLSALRIPNSVLYVVLHPVGVTPIAYYIALRIFHLMFSIPVRVFLSRFGLDVRSFSGTSFRGLLLTFRIRKSMEINLRVDEIGIDVRTMRRLKVRVRTTWLRFRGWFLRHMSSGTQSAAAAAAGDTGDMASPSESRQIPRESSESLPPAAEPLSGSNPATSSSSSSTRGSLSKRLQIYACGVHIQLLVIAPQKSENADDDALWFDMSPSEERSSTTSRPTAAEAKERRPDDHVLDSEAQEIAAKLAKRLSATLRTYTYIASLFARWIDISVSDVSLMVVRSSDMARAGHGVTMHISNMLMWAESARESHASDSGWIPTDIRNSIRGIVDWLLRIFKIRHSAAGVGPDEEPLVTAAAEAAVEAASAAAAAAAAESSTGGPIFLGDELSSNSTSPEHMPTSQQRRRHQQRPVSQNRRDRSLKYLSSVAIEVNSIRLFPGIEGAQQHMNSRWELVKMLVMQDMLTSKTTSDGDRPHHRGPAINCQRCTIRNDVITTFWGLPKKVDQSIELGQTHVRAGMIESLIDELAIMCLVPSARTSDMPLHRLRALNSHLASVLRHYNATTDSASANTAAGTNSRPEAVVSGTDATQARHSDGSPVTATDAAATAATDTSAPSVGSIDSSQMSADEARDQVNRMFFQLHEILSKLRLEHVGIAFRVAELVFDLPLTPDTRSLVIRAPGMLRWRQRNIDVEAGYLWSAISSTLPSTVATDRLFADKMQIAGDDSNSWSQSSSQTSFVRDLDGHDLRRRSKDSTAFVRISTGTIQVIGLRTPSMTPDPRAEELVPNAPGFRLRYGTLYGEMSAFLSEDLSHHPSPQPVFSLDIVRPELTLDLHTQIAIDEARMWGSHISHRAKALRRIFADPSDSDSNGSGHTSDQTSGAGSEFVLSHRMHALVSLVFADVKAHVTVERAMYAVRPHVPLPTVLPADYSASSVSNEIIALRMRHMECHVLWNLASAAAAAAGAGVGDEADSSEDGSSADSDSFVTGADESVASSAPPVPCTPFIEAGGALMPTIQFRLSSSPISAQWETVSSAEESKPETSTRRLLLLKRGIRARGTAGLHIGPTSSKCSQIPRINANVDAEIGEVAAMLREYDFRHWLSMQPLWLVTQLVHMCNMDYKDSESPLQTLVSGGDPYALPPIEERRKILTATVHVLFESARITMMACDNEEDVLGGIEHGTQICLSRGAVDLRANGGSLESPHAFGFRPDAGRLTVNLECQQATMFLLAAVSPQSARPEIAEQQQQQQQHKTISKDFEVSDLCGYLAYDVQEHIVLARPLFNFCRYRLEPYRSRMIMELDTTTFTGVTNVSSVYRWSVFMHHIKYWSRRKKLARRMATQMEQPSPPDDIRVRINSEMLDLHGDLVSPKFFSFDQDLVQSLGVASGGASAGNQPPQMRFRVPKVRFSILKTQQDTDNDMVIKLGGPIATMYGSSTPKGQRMRLNMQPLMSLDKCQITMQFPRKAKKQQLGAEQGVRSNGSYSKIDIAFERGAMAFGHRYNMAETIDGYTLMQKGCKRIARKSTSTCYPPLPFPEAALENKSSVKMIIAALGNPRTMTPPALRSLSNVRPPPPPTLSEPDDIPKIDFHGPEFNVMIHDDPFETALSRIYQVGLQEQRERLSRLEAFETKAKDLRSKREQEFAAQASASRKNREARLSKASAISGNSRSGHRHHRQWRQHQSQRVVGHSATFNSGSGNGNGKGTPRALRGSSTFTSSNGGGPRPSQFSAQRPTLAGAQTFTSGQLKTRQFELPPPGKAGGQLRGIVSASMQDVTAIAPDDSASNSHQSRGRSYTTASHESSSGGLRHRGSGTGTLGSNEAADDDNDDDANYDDIEENVSDSEASQFQRMREAVELEIAAARARLMEVESREWVRAIRRKMMPPPQSSECSCAGAVDTDVDEMHFGEIFDMPSTKSSSHREQECGSPDAKLPYNFVAGSWTHPSAPLGRLVMSPMWLCLETPLSLLEFEQVESYLRYLDPATPHGLKWTTLIPMHMRLKCGDIRMQLRDFPFPLFRVPDPYRPETARIASSSATSYDEFYGGIEISSSLIIAERIAHERSLRSIYVPIGPRSSESGVDLPNVGWYISKSLQFPRIFAATSIMMFSAPSDTHMSSMRSQQHKILQTRLPPLPIMSAWGASYQPVISALMQRFEAATSKSADVSPSLPWWDKLRSRNHIKWRMAVIDAPPREKLNQEQWKQQARTYLGDAYLNSSQNLSSDQIACASERGQMFFLALDGRDPYQVTQKPGSYLFTMRGGVRICLNEGIPGTDLWDNASGRGIYSVPTADATPASIDLSEFMRLRCEEFLMGVPIIIDRQSAILKSMDQQGPSGVDLTPSMEDIAGIVGIEVDAAAADSEPLTWKKAYVDLLQSINSDNSARYTFITQSVDRLYFKVMLHLSGGVRLGIGLSSYIPPDSSGLRRNHWDVQPIAPESAHATALQGITDAYAGYRSSKLHTSVSLLCPFTDSEFDPDKHSSARSQPFAELYLRSVSPSADSRDNKNSTSSRTPPKSLSPSPPPGLLHLKSPDKSVLLKPPSKWTAYDTDALVSPMHSLFVSSNKQSDKSTIGSGSRGPKAEDLFFVPFTYLASDLHSQATPAAFAANAQPTTMAVQRSSAKPQCQISASAAIIESVQRYLPLYVSRMMLPVRKGTLYPFTETSDNKLGKCLRSMRLVLDLKNVELAYSQRDFEIKELESREMGMMGYNNDATVADSVLSPTPSDTSNGASQSSPGAKVEGTVRELKARVDSFSFNLLMEQTSIKLQVGGSDRSDDAILGSEDAASATGVGGDVLSSKRHARPRSNSSDYARPADMSSSRPKKKAETNKDQAKAEAKALRWGMGDASTEIDYLDVRLTQMAFTMPLFANPQAPDVLGKSKRLNRLRFAQDALDMLSEFEQSWISSDSIRDLKELDISEAVFSNPSVACVLWSPRMVYFTQRPEWTQFGGRLDEILDSSIPGGPFPSPANDAFDVQYKAPAGGGLSAQPVPMSLDSAVASMPTAFGVSHGVGSAGGSLATQRNLGTQRTRALSDVKNVTRLNRAYTAHGGSVLPGRENIGHVNSGSVGAAPVRHRRNTSMPWLLTKNASHDGTVHDLVSSSREPPPSALASATTQQTPYQPQPDAPPSPQQSFFGNIQSVANAMQRSTTQPNVSSVWLQQQQQQPSESGSTGPSPLLQPRSSQNPPPINTMPTDVTASDISTELKTPSSAMSYKSSFHLLELARSRQRRLTTSNSRQSISLAIGGAASAHPVPEPLSNYALVDLQRQPSLALDSALSNTQTARLAPTGPDPNVIMRDSRTTQAMLLQKRKLMLGTAIQHEQASLAHLSREFERASSRHSEGFRKEMVRRAEHIYELGARRKLINRCLRFLGVDPDVAESEQMAGISEPAEDDLDFDRDTQEVEKVLATLYRHRFLIYSGYLIWTTQVRDKLMRFLYIQDCLTAIEYYLSESATKVVRTVTSAKSNASDSIANPPAGGVSATDVPEQRSRRGTMASGRSRTMSNASADRVSTGAGKKGDRSAWQASRSHSPRSRRQSSDQRSVASGSSRHTTLHLPKILRRLKSHEKLGGSGSHSKSNEDSSGFGFLFRSKKFNQKQQQQQKKQQKKQSKKSRKTKEDYKMSKRSVGKNKFDRGLKSVWDDFVRYQPYYSVLVEFLNSQVSLRVDEKTSTTSAIAVAERVQLHRILLCNEDNVAEDTLMLGNIGGSELGQGFAAPPNDESIVKTRSLIELENVQVFTAKRDDFEHQAAYFVDCTYGSRMEGDASEPTAIWPAWIPIELLLSQGKHRARGIFDELAEADGADRQNDAGNGVDSSSESESDTGGPVSPDAYDAQPQQRTESSAKKRKHRKAWWLEDLSKYKRLMDRNNGLVVYDKANPHRIQGDSAASSDAIDSVAADVDLGGTTAGDIAGRASADRGKSSVDRSGDADAMDSVANDGDVDDSSDDDSDDIAEGGDDIIDFDEFDGVPNGVNGGGSGSQGLSHRANHFAVFLPELNMACTAEQYTAVYETVTELLVFIDPEKAAYMDHLNTILLGMDMDDLRGLLTVINATQEALRERLPVIHDWYAIQRSHVVLLREVSSTVAADIDARRQKSRAMSLLTLDRHRRALELQLRTAMDLFGAAQKQMRQQHRLEELAAAAAASASSTRAPAEQDGAPFDRGMSPSRRTAAAPSSVDRGSKAEDQHNPRSRANTAQSAGSALLSSITGGRKKPVAASLSLSSSSSSSSGMRSIESAQTTIARTIHLFISKATWHMLENDGQPLCDATLRWATLKAVTTSDQATHLLSEVHLLYVVNRLPNPMFTDLVGPYVRPKHPRPDFCVERMIRVRWSELAPVGGISIVERFEVDLFPLRLQLSHDIAQKLVNYLYPPQDSSNATAGGIANSKADMSAPESGSARNRRPTVSSISSVEGPGGAYQPSTLSPVAGSTSSMMAAATSPPAAPAPPPLSGGGSPTMFTDGQGGGRSMLVNRMMRRNVADESIRSSSVADDRQTKEPFQVSPQGASMGLLATMSGRSTPFSLFSENNSMINISQTNDNRVQVDQMKKRASSNKTFLNIKIGGSTLCISYQGKKTNNITDLRDFEFHAPRLELRNQVESYYELLMQVKKEYMSVVVQHTGALVKEKFRQLHNRKAWSKTSFGPDWEARRLLIDMDRRVDEDMAASIHGSSMSEREVFPEISPSQPPIVMVSGHDELPPDLGTLEPSSRMPSVSASVSTSRSASAWAGESPAVALAAGSGVESNDDSASIHSTTKGKAPLSKYMILDPRKLMGKRIPNVLPRNFARASESASASRSQTPAQSVPSSARFAQQGVGEGSSAPPTSPASSVASSFRPQIYSSMHLDMVSLSPTPGPRRNNMGSREHRSPSIPPQDDNNN